MRYHYRPKKKDPFSLSHLERLNKKELIVKKKEFEKNIKEIHKVFNHKDHTLQQKKSSGFAKIDNAYKNLKTNYDKLAKKIYTKKRYFIERNFFGGISTGSKVTYIICEEDQLSNEVIKKLEILKDTLSQYNSRLYNYKLNSFVNDLAEKYRIPMRRSLYWKKDPNSMDKYDREFLDVYYFKSKSYNPYDILETHINSDDEKLNLRLTDLSSYNTVLHPKKVFTWDKFWIKNCIEVQKDEFNEAKNYGTLHFFVGDFLEKYKEISKSFYPWYLESTIKNNIFKDFKDTLIEHFEKYLRKVTLLIRSKERNAKLSEDLNSVYILSNKSYPNVYKVGWTSFLPEERAEQLSGETGVLYPFKVVYKKKFKNAEKTEKKIHKKFSSFRVKKNKEYFEINLKELIKYIDKL